MFKKILKKICHTVTMGFFCINDTLKKYTFKDLSECYMNEITYQKWSLGGEVP